MNARNSLNKLKLEQYEMDDDEDIEEMWITTEDIEKMTDIVDGKIVLNKQKMREVMNANWENLKKNADL